ncbi:MAG: Gfo/Idh/MocA family oxidoreductase, partial [Clostridia bacterium]|nr:Gfo/Idh/MocA family oxidoreductase [Clostridia bacterium]
MDKVRIGVIGAGGMANVHIEHYLQVEDAEVVALCDINPVRLKKTAEKFGIKKTFESVDEMLKSVELDAVSVCVWNCNHAECTIKALEAGLHVLCEKPMAYSTAEAIKMKEVADKMGKLLMIGFTMRFSDTSHIAMDFIDNGYMGDIYYSKATYIRRHGAPGGWFINKKLSGGGPVIDLGVHVIDHTRYLMGNPKPVSVYAATFDKLKNRPNIKTGVEWKPDDARVEDIFDVEDLGTALIRYDNGAVTHLETSYSLNGEATGYKQLFGDKGGMLLSDDDMKLYTEMNGFLADVTPMTKEYKYSVPTFLAEITHFVDCVKNGTKCIAPAEDGVIIMKILDAIYESARTG